MTRLLAAVGRTGFLKNPLHERYDNGSVDAVFAKKRKHLAKVPPPPYREVVHVRSSTQ